MKFKYVIKWSHFAFLVVCILCACAQGDKVNKPGKQPNVILIMADDLGYETIRANGGTSYQTPELDRMALNGMRFEHCYAQPLCTPSRVQLMTGIYNVRNYIRFGLLDTTQTTFGHIFQNAGYRTCVVGKWQLGKNPASPQHAGFDKHCLWQVTGGRIDSTGRDTRFSKPVLQVDGTLKTYADTDYGPRVVSDYAMDFIEQSQTDGKPFFLYYPMILTHCPFSPTPDSPQWIKDDSTIMEYKGNALYFNDMVLEMDNIVAKINRRLEALGIKDNTLVIFTGDNGTDAPVVSNFKGRKVAGAKGQSTDAGTRVPLIVEWPDMVRANTVNTDLIDFSDILPTIGDAAAIAIPDSLDLDGRSFLSQLKGQKGRPREWVYNWYSRSGDANVARVFARTKRYKLYSTGEFYDIPNDVEEQNPIVIEKLDSHTKEIHSKLREVLENYAKLRTEKVAQ